MSSQPVGRSHPPSIERVLAKLRRRVAFDANDPERSEAVTAAVRAMVDEERARLADGGVPRTVDDLARDADALLASFEDPDDALPGAVINATGVVLHTNLGRAPWPAAAIAAAATAAQGYDLLELDLRTGRRGPRFRRAEEHLVALTGAEDALVVNNNAAAVAIAVGLAGPGGGVVVSRGELVEIGGGVRIPEIIERAGARLIEVGTTNRTRASDFERPLVDGIARVVLRVHPSNFTMAGFIEEPDARQVADIAHAQGAIVIDDLGSGALLATERFGLLHEPTPGERLAAGADVVTFSGDKLVGGPQVGLVVGRADLIGRLRRDPLARAMRPDKAILAAVAATLGLYRAGVAARSIPIWVAIATTPAVLRARADGIAKSVPVVAGAPAVVEVTALRTAIGGGSLPGQSVPSWGLRLAVAPAVDAATALRQGEPPILARIVDDAVVLDLRTVDPGQDAYLAGRIGELAIQPG
jgi:L-seryl-tRNA(Ser) seleniumtransferase